jgi:hypothetical protein
MVKQMDSPPDTIEFQAVQMLSEAGYVWDDSLFAFRRKRKIDRETTEQYLKAPPKVIAFEELDDHGLVLPRQINGPRATPEARRYGLSWLADRIKEDTTHAAVSPR